MSPPRSEGFPVWERALVAVNAVTGVALWFFAAGRYSFVGSLRDLLFGPIVGVIALTTVIVLRVSGVRVNQLDSRALLVVGEPDEPEERIEVDWLPF